MSPSGGGTPIKKAIKPRAKSLFAKSDTEVKQEAKMVLKKQLEPRMPKERPPSIKLKELPHGYSALKDHDFTMLQKLLKTILTIHHAEALAAIN